MEVITQNNIDYQKLADALRRGGAIIYPTDTAYALGADATNAEAIEKIFKIKGRDASRVLSLIMADRRMAEDWAEFSPATSDLANKYWPGPLTLVLPTRRPDLPSQIVQDGFIALRVPRNEIAQKLSARLGGPIVATSANRSGQGVCYTIKEVKRSLGASLEQVDYIIDSGALRSGGVSTVVKVRDDKIEIVRPGIIKLS